MVNFSLFNALANKLGYDFDIVFIKSLSFMLVLTNFTWLAKSLPRMKLNNSGFALSCFAFTISDTCAGGATIDGFSIFGDGEVAANILNPSGTGVGKLSLAIKFGK